MRPRLLYFILNDTPTPTIYPLSLHDALPILTITTENCDAASGVPHRQRANGRQSTREVEMPSRREFIAGVGGTARRLSLFQDRKSTRLNSSHITISYAVFCLKKKK